MRRVGPQVVAQQREVARQVGERGEEGEDVGGLHRRSQLVVGRVAQIPLVHRPQSTLT